MTKEKIDNFKIYAWDVEPLKELLIIYQNYLNNFIELSKGLPLTPMKEYDFYVSLLTYTDEWSNQWLNQADVYLKKSEILTYIIKHNKGLMNLNKIKGYFKIYKIEQEILKQTKL